MKNQSLSYYPYSRQSEFLGNMYLEGRIQSISNRPGTTGNVGIGGSGYSALTTPSPLEKLEVWNGNISQTNVDLFTNTAASSANSSNNLFGLSPGTCPVFGLTTNNLGTTNTIPGIANSFVQVGINANSPEVRWGGASLPSGVLAFNSDNSITACNSINVMNVADPNTNQLGANVAIEIMGDGIINSTWSPSDARFKENIKKIENAKEIINNLVGTTYKYNKQAIINRNFSDRNQFGLIAQDVSKVVPDVVMEMPNGYMAVNYVGIIPILIEAFKIQQSEIDSLKNSNLEQNNTNPLVTESLKDTLIETKVDSLSKILNIRENQLDSINSIVSRQENEINEIKSILNSISKCLETSKLCIHSVNQNNEIIDLPKLFQNIPNPFSDQTKIQYYLPLNSPPAFIEIFDVNGRTIEKVALTKEGNETITISSQLLPSGSLYYHLNCGNKIYGPYKMAVVRN